ncbi:MAG TPA: AAA family ATPase [Clostridiales bacterium]|nr:AAA family ATPase [Clostridiales bacterium]
MKLDTTIANAITELHQKMDEEGKLLSKNQLEQYYQTFKSRFGVEKLSQLDGEELLNTMHNLSNTDSLVYWLEYKNDEEFPARFGSIAGGSGLKYGIYKRKETGQWMAGAPQNQIELSVEEAIQIARKHRDQLQLGAELLDALTYPGDDQDYARLQSNMDANCPDVSDTAWGHKYFSLLYPEKLDDYHNPEYQRFHLIKLLQLPPEGKGRYIAAGRFVAISRELKIPLNSLTTITNYRDGRPHKYWRIGTKSGSTNESFWEKMRSNSHVSIGWSDVGDLSWVEYSQKSKDQLYETVIDRYSSKTPQEAGKINAKIFNFVTRIEEGDIVLAAEGKQVLGIGRIIGDYEYDATLDFPHLRPVEWLSFENWELEEGLRSAVAEIRKPVNQVEIERKILTPEKEPPKPIHKKLSGIPGRIQGILQRKRQVILYGPPGTGKTYWALKTAKQLAAIQNFGDDFESLSDKDKSALTIMSDGKPGSVQICTFHPAYGYEDFIEGFRPMNVDGQLVFERRDGVFKRLCKQASKHEKQNFYLIIDEINRGDIPRIFGELITILERDKRGIQIFLPISDEAFVVPDNVYIISTMNTADRSIALLDTALRRRFGFIELMPDPSILGDTSIRGIPLRLWLEALNQRILQTIGRDARNLQIGHAYFLEKDRPVAEFSHFARIIQDDVLPLLEEYCYEDYEALEKIIGKGLIDRENQLVRHELFETKNYDDLIQALLSPFPEIGTSAKAVSIEQKTPVEEDEISEDSDNLNE